MEKTSKKTVKKVSKKVSTTKKGDLAKKIQALSDEINKNITDRWFKTVVLEK